MEVVGGGSSRTVLSRIALLVDVGAAYPTRLINQSAPLLVLMEQKKNVNTHSFTQHESNHAQQNLCLKEKSTTAPAHNTESAKARKNTSPTLTIPLKDAGTGYTQRLKKSTFCK